MQHLDLNQPGLPDLQFVLMVVALCTSDIDSLNAPESVRETVFNRCWALMHESPPPTQKDERVLNLMLGDEVMLEAMVHVIRQAFEEYGFEELIWEQMPTEPSRESTPASRDRNRLRPVSDRPASWATARAIVLSPPGRSPR